jgi:hypothetical protein
VTLGWSYPDKTTVFDLAGFRIERSGPGGTVALTEAPTPLATWTDAGPLEAGAEYTYTVTATDCVWERYLRNEVTLPYTGPLSSLTIGPISPGGLRRYAAASGSSELAAENFVTSVSDTPSAYLYHNNVKLFLQNTSRSAVTIKKMAVAWDNPNVVLDRVVVGGSAGTTARTVSAGAAASGASFAVNAVVGDTASGTGAASAAVPLVLRFTTPTSGVNRLADMRGQTLVVSLWVRNNSLTDVECSAPTKITVTVPRGPLLGGFTQDAPGTNGIS